MVSSGYVALTAVAVHGGVLGLRRLVVVGRQVLLAGEQVLAAVLARTLPGAPNAATGAV